MSDQIGQELSLSLIKLDINNNHDLGGGILANPFYEPYDNTDESLFKKTRHVKKMRVNPFKKKYSLQKPYLRRLESRSPENAKNWLELCKNEMQEQITWVKYENIKSKRSYNMKDLNNECNDIAYSIDPNNEFPLKKMSEMAAAMYT